MRCMHHDIVSMTRCDIVRLCCFERVKTDTPQISLPQLKRDEKIYFFRIDMADAAIAARNNS